MPSVKKENQIIIKKGSYPRENELTPIDDENELPELEPELVIPFWVAMMSYEHPSPIGNIVKNHVPAEISRVTGEVAVTIEDFP